MVDSAAAGAPAAGWATAVEAKVTAVEAKGTAVEAKETAAAGWGTVAVRSFQMPCRGRSKKPAAVTAG